GSELSAVCGTASAKACHAAEFSRPFVGSSSTHPRASDSVESDCPGCTSFNFVCPLTQAVQQGRNCDVGIFGVDYQCRAEVAQPRQLREFDICVGQHCAHCRKGLTLLFTSVIGTQT